MPRTWLALSLTLTTIAAAQEPTGHAAVDSAAVARAAWRAAARTADTQEAYRAVTRAVRAWPAQPAYIQGQARLAARLADDSTLLAAMRSLIVMEAGAGLAADSAVVRRAAANSAVDYARGELINATGARRHSGLYATLPDSTIFAEGLTADTASGRLFVASVRHRTIYEVSAKGVIRDLDIARHAKVGAILGVRFDERRGELWATTAGLPQMRDFAPGDTTIAALLRIRIADGTIERRWDLPPEPAGHAAGDLAVAPSGDVWVSDSRAPVLYRLRRGADSLERLTHPLFRSLQGIAPTPNGNLYVADYSHGLLWVDPSNGNVLRIGDAPGTTSLGLDGIAWYNGDIIGVQNGVAPPRIVRFRFDQARTAIASVSVIDRTLPEADEPTIGTVVGNDFLYVSNSQWEKYDESGRRVAGTALAPTMVRRVGLEHRQSQVRGDHGGPALGFLLLGGAPPALLLLADSLSPGDTIHDVRSLDHVSTYFSGGLNGDDAERNGWAHSQAINVLYHGWLAEVRVETFQVGNARFVTSRAGRLFARQGFAGGFTLGYRQATGDSVQNAFEIGLPLVFGTGRRWLGRMEATYVISSLGVSWNYRIQTEVRVQGTPFVGGGVLEVKPLHQDAPYSITLGLLLGVRAGPARKREAKGPVTP